MRKVYALPAFPLTSICNVAENPTFKNHFLSALNGYVCVSKRREEMGWQNKVLDRAELSCLWMKYNTYEILGK